LNENKSKGGRVMEEKNRCQGCIESVMVTEEVLRELVEQIEGDRTKMVSDAVYKKRVKICEDCSSLRYGTTCAHSGYLVHYQAKLKQECCPFPGRPKWGREE
jgi:hypothetical protein